MIEVWKFVLVVLCAGIGAYLGSYLKRKGENLATHEDIDKLVGQVRAVTTATKEIEAKISSDVWDRQKHWELKRDALFEAMREAATLQEKLTAMHGYYQTEKTRVGDATPERKKKQVEVFVEFNKATDRFGQTIMVVGLVSGSGLQRELLLLAALAETLADKITSGQPDAFLTSMEEWTVRLREITAAMRKELGIQKVA